eukprot:gb/GECH01001517.1/.p1 GENE.gb/GECH01001517.1/~~gb/GECH01001517.1/.p1  ORF type:complete len:671 (+),score=159.66 gb/GECH01001517.1/:1-2013(+)
MRVIVSYGSVTGNAESIAERIHETLISRNISPDTDNASFTELNSCRKSVCQSKDRTPTLLIIVVSTTGSGDAPDNAGRFWRFIKRRSQPSDLLSHVTYTVLGLGDSNYENFCHMGISIDERMKEIGATRFYDRGEADDATGLEDVVEPWIDGLWNAIEMQFRSDMDQSTPHSSPLKDVAPPKREPNSPFSNQDRTPPIEDGSRAIPETKNISFAAEEKIHRSLWDRIQEAEPEASIRRLNRPLRYGNQDQPIQDFTVCGARFLTSSRCHKQVAHLEFDISNLRVEYSIGDTIGVYCPNPQDQVQQVLRSVGETEESAREKILQQVQLSKNEQQENGFHRRLLSHLPENEAFTLYDAIKYSVDISSVTQSLFRSLSKFCSQESERRSMALLGSDPGRQEFRVNYERQHVSVAEVLEEFPSCKITGPQLLSLLPPQRPRYYSIASSPLSDPGEIHIAFTRVEYETPPPFKKKRHGLCSTFLYHMAQQYLNRDDPINIPAFIRNKAEFSMPYEPETPMIMVGPGTGVAPFRGVLRHRAAMRDVSSSLGKTVLFFGSRARDQDFLYGDELRKMHQDGVLDELHTAFSREADAGMWYGGVYVQDRMLEQAEMIADVLLQQDGAIYVCGDAQSMARDVHRVLGEILGEEGDLESSEVQQLIDEWLLSGRYQRDVWT